MLKKIMLALALALAVTATVPVTSNAAYSSGGYDASGAPVGPYSH